MGENRAAGKMGGLTREDVGRMYVAGRDDLFRLVWLVTGDAEVAEDLVQEAYTRLYEHPERVRGVDKVDAYVRSIALNLARSRFARRARRGRLDLRIAHDPTGEARSTDRDPMRHVDDRTTVAAALDALSTNQRLCVVCRYWLGMTDAQVAETVGMSLGTVKTHLRRALATLREHFADEPALTLEADPCP